MRNSIVFVMHQKLTKFNDKKVSTKYSNTASHVNLSWKLPLYLLLCFKLMIKIIKIKIKSYVKKNRDFILSGFLLKSFVYFTLAKTRKGEE